MNKTLKNSFRLFDVLPPFVSCRRDNSRKKFSNSDYVALLA